MSQAMNQKTATKKKHRKSRLPVVETPEELSGAEKLFEKVQPHLTTIGLVIVAGTLGFIAIAFMMRSRFDQNAAQWRELSTASAIALRTGDISGLKTVADTYPDTKAGLWALQMAGDEQLRRGIEQLSFDREAGNQMIEKGKNNFKRIVDAPQTTKTTMLDRRSSFSLAYAYESLGQFDEAKSLYEQIINLAPDSAFANPARRGLERASNEQYVDLYTKFANFEEEVIGEAPGPALPDRPVIEFPEALPAGQKPPADNASASGGEFVPATTTLDAAKDEGAGNVTAEKTEDDGADSTPDSNKKDEAETDKKEEDK
jgi:tetratricopeptide (TPR) repeat protein